MISNCISDQITDFANLLEKKGVADPRRQAEQIIADVLNVKRTQIYLNGRRPLTEKENQMCQSAISRRAQREPPQLIKGTVEFLDCVIEVTSDVLIPRQETEILADKAIAALSTCLLQGRVLWDVCTGSGCIGIAMKKKYPDLKVVLSDISDSALALAEKNAKQNGVDVEILQGDLLRPFQERKADFIICNPPYVSLADYDLLDPEVKLFEPKIALIASSGGLAFYERLAETLPQYLNNGGKVWLEIGSNQGQAVSNLFLSPIWKQVLFEQDWAGHDRFFFLEIE